METTGVHTRSEARRLFILGIDELPPEMENHQTPYYKVFHDASLQGINKIQGAYDKIFPEIKNNLKMLEELVIALRQHIHKCNNFDYSLLFCRLWREADEYAENLSTKI